MTDNVDTAAIDRLFARFDRRDGPGVVVGAARHGRTIYRRAFGLANVEHGVAMTPATRVSICSVTKHMTCAAVLKLAEDARLSLDDPIGRWLPELQPAARLPTLRQLMDHTAGVRCHLDTAAFNGVTPHPVGLPMRMMQRQRTVNFQPGRGMMYCNGGYVLLSMAIERASGLTFENYLEQELFAPLRMDATESPRTWWPVRSNVATFYLPHEGGGWKHGFGFEQETLGGGSVVSSIDDMLRWAQHLRGNAGAVSLGALTAPPRGADAQLGGVYRYGLTDQRWRGTRIVEHGGGGVGASCHLLIAPDEALDIFVFCNSIEPAQELAREVAAIVLGDRLQPDTSGEPVSARGCERLLGQFIDEEQGLIVGFADLDGQLGISMFAGPTVPLLRHHEATNGELPFHIPTAVGPRYFRYALDAGVQWLDGDEWRTLQRFEPQPEPVASVLTGIAGCGFHSDEAGATLRFSERNGGLTMESCGEFGRWDFHCRIVTGDMLVFGFYEGSSSWLARLRRVNGEVHAIEMSSTRTRGLVFERRAG